MNRLIRGGNAAFTNSGLLLSKHIVLTPSLLFARHASLSAIHRGLRRSESVDRGSIRPGNGKPGKGKPGLGSSIDSIMMSQRHDTKPGGMKSQRRHDTNNSGGRKSGVKAHPKAFRQSRESGLQTEFDPKKKIPAQEPQTENLSHNAAKRLARKEQNLVARSITRKEFKLARAKDEFGRETRRKRFNNPSEGFGKKSIVYQLKHGVLKDLQPGDFLNKPVPSQSQDNNLPHHSDSQKPTVLGQSSDQTSSSTAVHGDARQQKPQMLQSTDRFISRNSRDRPRASSPEQTDSWSGAGKEPTGQHQDSRQVRSRTDSSSSTWQQRPQRGTDRPRQGNSRDLPRASNPEQTDSWSGAGKEPTGQHRDSRQVRSRTDSPGSTWQQRPQRGTDRPRQGNSRDLPRASNPEQTDSWSGAAKDPTGWHQDVRKASSSTERDSTRQQRPQSNDRPGPSNPRDKQRTTDQEPAESGLDTSKNLMAMAIKYTTAASQFLYGRSVVKAALEQSRRKLYNLYVQGGENRIDSSQNTSIVELADSKGVPVTIVPSAEQRLMDKMSAGRPHNGFILETSPLPKIPVKSLAAVEKSTPGQSGFHVVRGHQSREDESVNGTDTLIQRPAVRGGGPSRMPLVLLLHEITDPGNLGALLRTASFLGVDAVGITDRFSAALNPVALKSAAGAVDEMNILVVNSPGSFIEDSQAAGWRVYAAAAPSDGKALRMPKNKHMSIEKLEKLRPLVNNPCILILGNEGHGLPRHIKISADHEVSIPLVMQDSCVDSLNVSVAGALLVNAFVKGAMSNAKPAGATNSSAGLSSSKANVDLVDKEENVKSKNDLF